MPLNLQQNRYVNPVTSERDYTADEIEFMNAMDDYKRDNRRPFPAWSEVLGVLLALGFRKVAERGKMPVFVRGNNQFPTGSDDA